MDFEQLRTQASARVPADAWAFYQGTADDADPERDERAWQQWELVPRMLTRLRAVDQRQTIGGDRFAAPLMIAATAAHAAVEPEGEILTRQAAAAAGLLMALLHAANVELARVAGAADTPWWAQIYLSRDRRRIEDYVARAAAAGATALVLTVDNPLSLASAPFRQRGVSGPAAVMGNVDRATSGGESETAIGPEDVSWLAAQSGLPVWVKGVMHPRDAQLSIEAGAAGVIVSNHGRRVLPGVVPTAAVLGEVAAAVGGQVPVLVDGGIRSGADVVRALALGATAVGIGRPVLWALGAGGRPALDRVLAELVAETGRVMAALGAATISDLSADMVRPAWGGAR